MNEDGSEPAARRGRADSDSARPGHPHGNGHFGKEFEELGRAAAELTHDLASALSVLSSRMALTREDVRRGTASVEDMDRLQRDCDALRSMVRDVVEEFRGRKPSPEVEFPAVQAAEETVERYLTGAPGITIRLSMSMAGEVHVAGPRSFFDRLLLNLIKNAGRHARSQVLIHLSYDGEESGGWLTVSVEDDGRGIDPSLSETLFDPLTRGPSGQVGLGLSVVRWAAERLGGRVESGVSRELGGAAFRARLPVRATSSRRSEAAPRPPASPEGASGNEGNSAQSPFEPLAGLRVAVVDDEPMLRNLYERLLARSRARAVPLSPDEFADEGGLAGAIVDARPDVVLLDLDLGRLGGMRTWKELGELDPDLRGRTLFLTGAPQAGTSGRGDGLPPTLSKLLDWNEIAEEIRVRAGNRRNIEGPSRESGGEG